MKKYIFLDIDGTLYDHNTKSIPESAICAIEQAHQNGHYLYLCSGRTILEMSMFSHLPFDGYICSAGAQIYQHNQLIYDHSFPNEDVEEMICFAKKKHIGIKLETPNGSFLDEITYPIFYNWFQFTSEQQMSDYTFYHYTGAVSNISKISFFYEDENVVTELEQRFPNYNFPRIPLKSNTECHLAVECSSKKCSKGIAVERVMEYNHSSVMQAIGIGDSLNDVDLIKTCGLGIAMGNAIQEIQDIADDITTAIDHDGIYNAFKKHQIIK